MSNIQHQVTPEAGRYDFDGEYAPHSCPSSTFRTFTLSIFQWLPKAGARGKAGQVKRSKIIQRFTGRTRKPEEAYDTCRRLCEMYNNGTLAPPKSATA